MLRLIDNQTGDELKVGSWITDDEGTIWFITGFGLHPIGGKFVEMVKMDQLREIAEQFRADSYDLTVEYSVLDTTI